ncbi:MAG: SpoIIE family protein phosphatase [Eubacterium sp.]|nr:SpoIIE family protein phosphatase [Eubacterium sp.]
MFTMILKMSAVTLSYVALSGIIWWLTRNRKLKVTDKIFIGLVYGLCSVASTHYGVDYGDMMLNVRDIGPLAAGLFFDPVSGLIAGLIGGIERFIVGEFFVIGAYTRIACSVSTCLAGVLSMVLALKVFKGKKPSPFYAFFMGAVMEVFHMYVVFGTHRSDMHMAFKVVKTCSIPMIIFTGLGLALSSVLLQVCSGEWKNPFRRKKEEEMPVSARFQKWLFAVISGVIVISFLFTYVLQTQAANQRAVGVADPTEIFEARDQQAYEIGFSYILIFTVMYVLISFLVHKIVVKNIEMINTSLGKITDGNLDEVVGVRNSSEFATLSDDINQTVEALKGYIDAAEKRIEQELEFARTIQESALPTNFVFPNRNEFELFATMDPAKEVGGDFYDFFFVDTDKVALVIADVSGKGIPAALFMMRSKTAIRTYAQTEGSPAEVLFKANNALCEGNDAEMFVTAWIGIIDLKTGVMKCANAGHEFPVIRRADGDFEYIKDKHTPPLATMEGIKPKEYELEIGVGDEIFVYTDGIPEAINEKEEQYDADRLLVALNKTKDKSLTQILASVREDVRIFVGEADQFDDITMLAFRYKGIDTNKRDLSLTYGV